ncbi:MAG: integrator complex subunit 1 [Acidobacteriota bacterium]
MRSTSASAKGREFCSVLLAHLEADSLWDLGTNKTQRPVWISFVGSPSAARAFTANFRGGARASRHSSTRVEDSFEIPRSSGHRWVFQVVEGMTVTTAYLPSLFHVDPTVPGDDVRFIFMPPRWWVTAQSARLAATFGERAEDAARAALFAAYLDRRTRLPVLQDFAFQLRLFEAAKKEDWLHRPGLTRYDRSVLYQEGVEACGLDAPLACWVRHDVLEGFLAREVRRYYDEEVIPRGATRIDQDRRVLPGAGRPAEQLCLDFSMAIG